MLVAILDDDDVHNALVAGILRAAGYGAVTFTRPAAFLAELRRQTFDLLIVDWAMPEASGVQVIAAVRGGGAATGLQHAMPILMVTSRTGETDVVEGLNAGADDYVVKPVSPAVLQARVAALLRRAYPQADASAAAYEFGDYRFDPATETAIRHGQAHALTAKEFQLALLFFKNLGRPLSRDYLLQHIWGRRVDVETRTLDAHISRLRNKLSLRPAHGYRLVTVYGFGYRLDPCEASPAGQDDPADDA